MYIFRVSWDKLLVINHKNLNPTGFRKALVLIVEEGVLVNFYLLGEKGLNKYALYTHSFKMTKISYIKHENV